MRKLLLAAQGFEQRSPHALPCWSRAAAGQPSERKHWNEAQLIFRSCNASPGTSNHYNRFQQTQTVLLNNCPNSLSLLGCNVRPGFEDGHKNIQLSDFTPLHPPQHTSGALGPRPASWGRAGASIAPATSRQQPASLLGAATQKSWEDGKHRTCGINPAVVIEKSNKEWLCINPRNLNKAVKCELSPMKTGEAAAAKP